MSESKCNAQMDFLDHPAYRCVYIDLVHGACSCNHCSFAIESRVMSLVICTRWTCQNERSLHPSYLTSSSGETKRERGSCCSPPPLPPAPGLSMLGDAKQPQQKYFMTNDHKNCTEMVNCEVLQ